MRTLFDEIEQPSAIPLDIDLVKLIRHAPDGLLATFLGRFEPNLCAVVTGYVGRGRTRRIVSALEQLPADPLGLLTTDAERIVEMTDELGQSSIQSVVADERTWLSQKNGVARSLWLFLEDPERFMRAEEIRHADHYRLGRLWDGFQGPRQAHVSDRPEHRRAFEQRVCSWFRSDHVKVEIYQRVRIVNSAESNLVQLVIYREGLSESVLEFADGGLSQQCRRPVYELALTYDPASGGIEVVAQDQNSREEMARAFSEILLQRPVNTPRVPLRQYDLSSLMRPRPFPTETVDGIASVEITMLTFRPNDSPDSLSFRKGGHKNIHEHLVELFQDRSPLRDGFRIQQARLTVHFHTDESRRRRKVIHLTITLPNVCSLKGKTKYERLVCDKYLPLWGLIREV
ncbi:MAG: hypothetical protein HQL58_13400 [Magnetococcales bacterium]|nr:hypothetical protein [Magnetococcales bacterium]